MISVISIMAMSTPMHNRGPPPNGKYDRRGRAADRSGRKRSGSNASGFSHSRLIRRPCGALALAEQQALERAEIVQQDQAGEHVLAQAVELVIDEPQRVEAPLGARRRLRAGGLVQDRRIGVVDRLPEKADELVRA